MSARESIETKLKSLPLFSALDDRALHALAGIVVPRHVSAGTVIFTRSEAGSSMYLLVSGRVRVTRVSADGREIALSHLAAPAHFGEMSLIDSRPRSADAIAACDCEILAIDAKDFSSVVKLQPKLALYVIATLCERLRETNDRLEEMAFEDTTHRVARVLLKLTDGRKADGDTVEISGVTHYEIAAMVGASRETTSRAIESLVEAGIVERRGRRIVADLPRLRERVGLAQ